MSNPTGPQDPYGRPEDGSSGSQGQPGGSSWGQGDPSWGQGQGNPGQGQGYPGGDMGSGYSAPPPPPGYYGGGAGAPMYGGTEKNNLGIWSLVLGILGFVGCGLFASIPAVIVGGKAKEAAAQGLANNGSLGQVGVVLGWVGIVLSIVGIIAFIAIGGFAALTDAGTTGF
ncbi:MAG: DUF4190 domain-containing protein [Actinotalea sp.]|nr:DUF4190 domain-containing protein [Actinotalea sp.]